MIRDPENGRFVEKHFELLADFQSSVRLLPDHDGGRVAFHIANLDGFETESVVFPAFEVFHRPPRRAGALAPAA